MLSRGIPWLSTPISARRVRTAKAVEHTEARMPVLPTRKLPPPPCDARVTDNPIPTIERPQMVRRYFERVYWVDVILNILRSHYCRRHNWRNAHIDVRKIYGEPVAESGSVRTGAGQHLRAHRARYTLVYGILLMINFAHGEVYMAGAFTAFFVADWTAKQGYLASNPILSILLWFVVAAVTSMVVAILLERVAYRPLRGAPAPGAAYHGHRRLLLSAIHLPRVLRFRLSFLPAGAGAARHDFSGQCLHPRRAAGRVWSGDRADAWSATGLWAIPKWAKPCAPFLKTKKSQR